MSLSSSDLTKMLQAQLSIQIAITTLLEGQRQIVDLIMSKLRTNTESKRKISIKGCDVKIKRLKLTGKGITKKKIVIK